MGRERVDDALDPIVVTVRPVQHVMIVSVSPIAFLAVPAGDYANHTRTRASVAAAITGFSLAALQLAPVLGRGYVLNRDMVFVPKLPLNDTVLGVTGVPRAVPSDLVVALLSRVVPGDVVQDLLLVLVIAIGGWGAGRLWSRSVGGAVAAAALYAWNPYLTEHLLLGQWAILLGYAALPWIAAAAIAYRAGESRALGRLVVWIGVAAVGGASAELLAALVALPVIGWPSSRVTSSGPTARAKQVGFVLVGLGVLALPWLIPALTNPGGAPGDRVGTTVFASRADTPFGTLGSVLSLGGTWNSTAVPPGRSHWYAALAALVVTAAAVWGLVLLRQQRNDAAVNGIVAAASLGLALSMWAHLPGLNRGLHWLGAHSQAFDLLRDGQRLLAPFVLAVAIGWGYAVTEVSRQLRQAPVLAAVPLLLLPAAAWGASGKLVAGGWPSDWSTVAAASRQLPHGPVLVLPWASVRIYPWNGDRPMIDPASRWLDRRVVGDGRLLVRTSGGGIVATPQEDPLARAIGPAVDATGSLTATLRTEGYAGVLVERDVVGGAVQAARLRGSRLVATTPTLSLYEVTATSATTAAATGSQSLTLAGDAVASLAVIISGTISAFSAASRIRRV